MGIFLNYGGAGSHHGGAGRITLGVIMLLSIKSREVLNLTIT